MKKQYGLILLVLAAGIAAFLVLQHRPRDNSSANGKPLERVSVRLDWLPQAQYAGVYVAKAKGLFAEQRLEVTINPGGVDFDPIKLVASGSDTYGLANADQLVVARGKGLPLVGIAAIFQENPTTFMVKKSSGISKPQDFVGRKVGIKVGLTQDILYRAMMTKLGVDRSRIQEVPVQFDMASFFSGSVDVWPGYTINEALVAKERAVDINLINPADYGIFDYAGVVFTTERQLSEKRDQATRFLHALLAGWKYAVDHPDESVKIVLQAAEGLKETHETAMMQAVIPLVTGSGKTSLGQMEPAKWQETYRFMVEQKLVDKPFPAESLYTLGCLDETKK